MAIDYSKMSVYGDTYGNNEKDLDAAQQDQETGIGEILIPNINTGYLNQGNDNQYVNRNINYDNLIIPSFEPKQESNMFTDAMGNIKSYAEKNKLLSGIMKAGSMIRDPIAGLITSAIGMLPKEDPKATAARNFYGENFGTTSSGSVASGIMQGYNPVYGNDFLNKLSRGIIPESGYGLGPAIDKRIAKINQTLNKYDKYKYGSKAFDPDKYNQQIKKLDQLKKIRAAELQATMQAEEKKAQEIRNAQEAAFARAGGNRAAQDAQRRADAATVAQANRDYSSGASYSGGESTRGDDTSYNDPFDPGGGEKDGGHIDGTNRRRYGMGGIVSL